MKVYEEIYEKYGEQVFRYALKLSGNKEMAEDLTQTTFLKAIENLKQFKGQCSVSTWLCTITRNEYLNLVKKKESQNISMDEVAEVAEEGFEEVFWKKENSRLVHKILHELKEPYKEVFTLRVFGELSYKEIGEIFEKSDLWARVTYRRARERIADEVKRKQKGGK